MNCISFLIYPIFRCRLIPNLLWIGAGGLTAGCAEYYGIKEKCAALSFNSGNYALINGIVSKEKGYGKKALTAIIQKNRGKYIIACCEDRLTGFYEKYGFEKLSKRFAIINEYK